MNDIPFSLADSIPGLSQEVMMCATNPSCFINKHVCINTALGSIPFELYKHQTSLIAEYHAGSHCILSAPRQMGKTLPTLAYCLWHAIFNTDACVAVGAIHESLKTQAFNTLMHMVDSLPGYIKPDVSVNDDVITFSNGSKIICAVADSNFGSAEKCSLVFLDEFAFYPGPRQRFALDTIIINTIAHKGQVIIASTSRRGTVFDDLLERAAQGKTVFKAIKYSVDDHPRKEELFKMQNAALL